MLLVEGDGSARWGYEAGVLCPRRPGQAWKVHGTFLAHPRVGGTTVPGACLCLMCGLGLGGGRSADPGMVFARTQRHWRRESRYHECTYTIVLVLVPHWSFPVGINAAYVHTCTGRWPPHKTAPRRALQVAVSGRPFGQGGASPPFFPFASHRTYIVGGRETKG